jgi:hypothetical protein
MVVVGLDERNPTDADWPLKGGPKEEPSFFAVLVVWLSPPTPRSFPKDGLTCGKAAAATSRA